MASDRFGAAEFLAGLFVGGVVGAVVGLLLAPQSGEETRAQIAERGIELRSTFEKKAGELQEKVPEYLDDQRRRLAEAVEKGKEAAAKKREEILGHLQAEKRAGTETGA